MRSYPRRMTDRQLREDWEWVNFAERRRGITYLFASQDEWEKARAKLPIGKSDDLWVRSSSTNQLVEPNTFASLERVKGDGVHVYAEYPQPINQPTDEPLSTDLTPPKKLVKAPHPRIYKINSPPVWRFLPRGKRVSRGKLLS